MPNPFRAIRYLLAASILLPELLSAALEVHVNPSGDDSDPGTLTRPVATPQGAQVLVRGLMRAGLQDPVEVIFAEGTYYLDEPLELRVEDSGTAAFPITWRAAAESRVVLSGGRLITGNWEQGDDGMWHVLLSTVGLEAHDWNFRQLFVDGNRMNRARFPDADQPNPFLYAKGGGIDHVRIEPGLVKSSWGTAADAQINIVAQWKFFNQWNTVTSVDARAGRINFADSERHGSITSGNWFWIEGVKEELDQTGEWFLDLRACLLIRSGAVFAEKRRMARRDEGAYPQRSVTEEQQSQPVFSAETRRAAVLLTGAGVGSAVTARCGDAPASPPWPRSTILAAAPPPIIRQALRARRLYYQPPPGVDPNTQTIIAPFLNRIVNVQGDVNAGTHVEHVHFEGLEFRHTTFSLGHIEARVHTDTAILFENTTDSSVKNCHFENIGGYALWLHLDSQRNVFDRNTVFFSGGGGVLLTGARFSYMDDTKVYTRGEPASKVAPVLNEITRNTIAHCGQLRYYGGGVHLDSRPFNMSMAPGNYIAHNHFHDLSRNGVFAFRNQGGNVVEYNHIHNTMQTTIDGACIHFATMNHLNAPNYILNNWLYDIWGYEQMPNGKPVRHLANGVFLDWDTSNTTVRDNWIYNAGGSPVKIIWDNWNIANRGNQWSDTVITPPFAEAIGPGGSASNGIDLPSNKLTGSIVHYTDDSLFSKTGAWTSQSSVGLSGLFVFNYLVGTAAVPSVAEYTLPITEDGTYQISLIYRPGPDRASNAPITIEHADGKSRLTWNMQQGSKHGFAVGVGKYRFEATQTAQVTLSTIGANGNIIADSVAFVKLENDLVPEKR